MALSSQVCVAFKVELPRLARNASCNNVMISQRSKNLKMFEQSIGRGFVRGSRKGSVVRCSHIASDTFTLGTIVVLPFYALMVAAPHAEFTKKTAASSLPYVLLGALYASLLYLSWTPDTLRLVFASKIFFPELPSIAKLFSSEMTLASAWIHILTVDLLAARLVYGDGLQNNIETRHSVTLCLLSCPIGILAHALTKALTKGRREKKMEVNQVINDEDASSRK